jgi:outer membrane murein-binding lipoprotein Lpp
MGMKAACPCPPLRSKHPKLADKKEAWAKRIEDKAAAQAEAARPAEVSHAKVTTLTMQRRTMADAVQRAGELG